jgi:SAM-dependent methyltransferase
MENPDVIWGKVKTTDTNVRQLTDELRKLLINNIQASKLRVLYGYIDQLTGGDKSVRILDYGCGGGQMVTYLRVLGYKNISGVDINSEDRMSSMNSLHKRMGFTKKVFFSYNSNTLPFDDLSYDLIISQQVLEHVHNVEQYFFECNRVLGNDGKMLFDFPHRLVPFDTHTRMWFVHYFPSMIRNIFYDKFRENKSQYYGNLLNLQPIWYYKRLLNTMFSSVVDLSEDRISSFVYRDYYEGNINIRLMIDKLVNTPFIGGAFRAILALFSNTTLIIKK